jgi:hypothetical protein
MRLPSAIVALTAIVCALQTAGAAGTTLARASGDVPSPLGAITAFDEIARRTGPATYAFDSDLHAITASPVSSRRRNRLFHPPVGLADRDADPIPNAGYVTHYAYRDGLQRIDDPADEMSIVVHCTEHRWVEIDHRARTYAVHVMRTSAPGRATTQPVSEPSAPAVLPPQLAVTARVDPIDPPRFAEPLLAYRIAAGVTMNGAALTPAETMLSGVMWFANAPEPGTACPAFTFGSFLAAHPMMFVSVASGLGMVSSEGEIAFRHAGAELPGSRFAVYVRIEAGQGPPVQVTTFERGNVSRAPEPASSFDVPAGYREVEPPPRDPGVRMDSGGN